MKANCENEDENTGTGDEILIPVIALDGMDWILSVTREMRGGLVVEVEARAERVQGPSLRGDSNGVLLTHEHNFIRYSLQCFL